MHLSGSKRVLTSTLLASSLLLLAGCNLDVTQYTLGRLAVTLADPSGSPVPNIRADLLLDDKVTVWRTTTTGADGRGEFDPAAGGVLIQGYFVRVILPADWTLATGEPNDKAVVPHGGSVVEVRFNLVRVTSPAP
jgi:hypothetical protein